MICVKCGIDKDLEFFSLCTKYKDKIYHRKTCKKCKQSEDIKRGRKNREAIGRELLNDYYIRKCAGFKKDTPKELIELKRQLFILKKTIHEHIQRSNPNGNRYQPETIGRDYRHQGRQSSCNKYPDNHQCRQGPNRCDEIDGN